MNKRYRLTLIFYIIVSSSVGSFLILDLLNSNNYIFNSINQKENDDYLQTSNNGMKEVIVFFNKSDYDNSSKSRFEFYGGSLKENEDWNGLFSNFSGFAGLIPTENISAYTSEYPDVNINTDEIIEVQMNYASVQTQAVNSSWHVNGYNGNTDSSIAVLDSGVNPNHDFLQGKISGWQNFVDQEIISVAGSMQEHRTPVGMSCPVFGMVIEYL